MKPWPTVRLGEVLTHYTEYIEAPEPREYRKLSVKLYGKGVVLDAPADGASLKMQRHQLANAGQVILSEIWGKKGAIGFVPPEGEGALCTSHFFLFDVREEKMDRRWLQAIFNANYLQGQLDAEAKGTTGYAAVRPKILLACQVPLPPLAEQRRVVARIEKLAAQIHEARTLRHQAAEEAEALPLSELSAVFLGEAERRGTTRLDQLLVAAGYGSSDKCETERAEGTTPVLRIPNVASERINLSGLKYARLVGRDCQRLLLSKGDVLVVRTNGSLELVGRSAVVPKLNEPFAFASYMIRLRFNHTLIAPDYAQRMLQHLRVAGVLVDFARTTAGQYNVSLGRLRAAEIPVPPLPDQRRIVAELDALQAEVDALKRLQDETATQMDALLPAILDCAFKGQL